MDDVVIDGVTYRPVTTGDEAMRIVIVDNRGLTFVGGCDLEAEGDWMEIHDARCIIRWGTEEHLAQLVHGPLKETVLGASETVVVQRSNVVAAYLCGGGWLS